MAGGGGGGTRAPPGSFSPPPGPPLPPRRPRSRPGPARAQPRQRRVNQAVLAPRKTKIPFKSGWNEGTAALGSGRRPSPEGTDTSPVHIPRGAL